MPVVPTDATVAADDDQAPPLTDAEKVVLVPEHRVVVPLMVPATGKGFTVTDRTAKLLPQVLVTV